MKKAKKTKAPQGATLGAAAPSSAALREGLTVGMEIQKYCLWLGEEPPMDSDQQPTAWRKIRDVLKNTCERVARLEGRDPP